jgi:hypothetical protein
MSDRSMRAAFAIMCLVSTAARSEVAGAPVVAAGDEWHFVEYYDVPSVAPNRVWKVTTVTPVLIVATENGEPLILTSELNVLDSPRVRETNPQALSFPLAVGKRWRYTTQWLFKPKGSKGSLDHDVTVLAFERVQVPAGEFDAFKIVSKAAISGTSPVNSRFDGEVTRTYWYAPAARAIVKSISHNPYLGGSTVELVTLQLKR